MMGRSLRVRVFNRQFAMALLWVILLTLATMALFLVGASWFSSVEALKDAMQQHSGWLLAWRVMLYLFILMGWRWMRRRLLIRETSPEARCRVVRTEWAALVALALLEGSVWLGQA